MRWIALWMTWGLMAPLWAQTNPLQKLWQAEDDRDIKRALRKIAKQDLDYASLDALIAAGRAYAADVPKGQVIRERKGPDGTPFPYWIWVPESYDPDNAYPVRMYLHGGINRPAWTTRDGSWWQAHPKQLREDHIAIFPTAWADKPWWGRDQIENLVGILHHVKRDYNLDENRIVLYGVSDGATGVFYQAMLAPTPWAGYLPFIGHPAVLVNPRNGVDAGLYAGNLRNQPMYMVNGANDRLYPTNSVLPFRELFEAAGTKLVFRNIENGGHDLNFWPQEGPAIYYWLQDIARNPFPDTLDWETNRLDCCDRAYWLVVEELGSVRGEADLDSLNTLTYQGKQRRAFPKEKPGGRVVLIKTDNQVQVQTRGVERFSLLISPQHFDLQQPIVVTLNGQQVHADKVFPDSDTLLRWYSRDWDRRMRFAAKITLEVPRQ